MDYGDLSFVLSGPGHSGSTWLGHALRAAPGIFVTHEINYLTWTQQIESLDRFFAGRDPSATILGEHSNNYFSWDGIPERLHALNPRLKIIIMVRDPVAKLLSNYLHDRRWGVLPSYITLRIAILPNYFERRYIHDSDYPANLRRWLDVFPPEQIYLYRSPADRPRPGQFADLVRWLGGTECPEPAPDAINASRMPLFPQMHRHATFGADGPWRSVCRMLDPVNVGLGRFAPPPVSEDDIRAVRDALGERSTLDQLKSLGTPGSAWL